MTMTRNELIFSDIIAAALEGYRDCRMCIHYAPFSSPDPRKAFVFSRCKDPHYLGTMFRSTKFATYTGLDGREVPTCDMKHFELNEQALRIAAEDAQ